jgi:predicted secreted hydrolase
MSARSCKLLALSAVVVPVFTGLAWLAIRETPPPRAASVPVAEALGGVPDTGFARALVPRPFTFPGDHGPHPGFRNEWWYYTGNVATAAGRRFGYQLTFFRIALAPRAEPRASAWATSDVWMAHLAVTDVAGRRFVAKSRLARGALSLAGARAEPFRVWLEDWSAAGVDRAATPRMKLAAGDVDVGVELVLDSRKPPVPQGDRGLSVKGAEPGQASHYYSLTRLDTRGVIRVGAERFAVTGTSWMDREWSTSALARDQVGWDWFALHLDDGRDLMVYRLRRTDGSADPASAGALIAPDGSRRPLALADVTIDVLGWWPSPRGDTRYPARWRLAIPSEDLVLEIEPWVADQEWTDPVRYWEGAVSARGLAGAASERGGATRGREVRAEGYAELVGYARTSRPLAR